MKRKDSALEGQIILHVDDRFGVGTDEFMNTDETTVARFEKQSRTTISE